MANNRESGVLSGAGRESRGQKRAVDQVARSGNGAGGPPAKRGGRKATNPHLQYFQQVKTSSGKLLKSGNWKVLNCLFCVKAKHKQNVEGSSCTDHPVLVKDIESRPQYLMRHLQQCQYVPEGTLQDEISPGLGQPPSPFAREMSNVTNSSTTSGNLSSLKQTSIKSYCPPSFQVEHIRTFTTLLINLFAVCALPFRLLEHPQFVALIHFLRASAVQHIPSVTTFRTSILKKRADEAKSNNMDLLRVMHKRGLRVSLMVDGWMDIAKQHVIGVVLRCGSIRVTYDSVPCGSDHDAISNAREMEHLLIRLGQDHLMPSSVCTDDAGQCGRMRRILALRWPSIVWIHCFAHQIVCTRTV